MEYLPHIVTIDFNGQTPTIVDWQSAVTAYLGARYPQIDLVSWYNTTLTGLPIEEAREIIHQAGFGDSPQPTAWIILAADTITPSTQNVLLKTLEEPPAHTLIILATTQPEAFLETIRSRCQQTYWTVTGTGSKLSTKELLQPTILAKALDPAVSVGQLISLANDYKERPVALELLRETLSYLSTQTASIDPKIVQASLQCWQELQHNVNTSLALEHWLFTIVSLRKTAE